MTSLMDRIEGIFLRQNVINSSEVKKIIDVICADAIYISIRFVYKSYYIEKCIYMAELKQGMPEEDMIYLVGLVTSMANEFITAIQSELLEVK